MSPRWPIFHGPVTLSYISKTIWCMSVIFSDNETVWPKLWPQRKYKSTWPIFHGLVILRNIFNHSWYNGSGWHSLTLPSVCRSVTYILWSSDFASYLEGYLMEKCCTWDNGSVWLKDRPCKIYVGQWNIFHGPLILPYIVVRLKLFLYIKKWHQPGVFVLLRAFALVTSFASRSIWKHICTPAAVSLCLHVYEREEWNKCSTSWSIETR